jgi:predicted esterase
MNVYLALATLVLGLIIVVFKVLIPTMAGRQAIVIPALKKHTATVIMAHGLGDSGAGWVSLAENWRRRGKFEDVKFIFPNAPNIPITINMGVRMPGWYDIVRRRDDVRSPLPAHPRQTHAT